MLAHSFAVGCLAGRSHDRVPFRQAAFALAIVCSISSMWASICSSATIIPLVHSPSVMIVYGLPPSSIHFLPTARLNGQADFGGQPQPSAEQGVLSGSRSFERRKTYLAVFWRFERPRQTGKRRKPKGQKRPPRRTAHKI